MREKYTKADIAKKLKRTPSSISNKVRELKLGGLLDNTEMWTFSMIAEAVGMDRSSIGNTWVKHGLKYVKRKSFCLVTEKELLRFMKEHPERWNATKCDYYLFYKYPWFIEKYEKEKGIQPKGKGKMWSDYEKQQFHMMKRRGYTHKQIAEAIGRTKLAVDHYSMKCG